MESDDASTTLTTDVAAYDVCAVPGGFHLAWTTGTHHEGEGEIHVGHYIGATPVDHPYPFDSAVPISQIATGRLALGISPAEDVGLLWQSTAGVRVGVWSPELFDTGVPAARAELVITTTSGNIDGITLQSKTLGVFTGTVTFVADALSGCNIDESGNDTTFHYNGEVTTINEMVTCFDDFSTLLDITNLPEGDPGILETALQTSEDEFGPIALSGGAAAITAEIQVVNGAYSAGGLSIRSRGLRDGAGVYDWVCHFSDDTNTKILSYHPTPPALIDPDTTRYNSVLASKSFTVGDEVFCWLRSTNASTHYLLAGHNDPVVAGYSDREEALSRAADYPAGGTGFESIAPSIPHVCSDPLNAHTFTWVRSYNVGDLPVGGTRTGDMNFLPELTTAAFGRSLYLSGSAVKNWDGETLADAGFQDYPVVSNATPTTVTGDHMTVLEYYSAARRTFSTISGNGVGLGPDGKRRQGVVRSEFKLGGPGYCVRRIGRPGFGDLLAERG